MNTELTIKELRDYKDVITNNSITGDLTDQANMLVKEEWSMDYIDTESFAEQAGNIISGMFEYYLTEIDATENLTTTFEGVDIYCKRTDIKMLKEQLDYFTWSWLQSYLTEYIETNTDRKVSELILSLDFADKNYVFIEVRLKNDDYGLFI